MAKMRTVNLSDQVKRQARLVMNSPLLREFVDAVPNVLVILNDQRQIVFANGALLEMLGVKEMGPLVGLRPGEALCCIHADASPDGCGSGEACAGCGAFLAIQAARQGQVATEPARIERGDGEDDLDFRVRATPVQIGGEKFIILALTDVGHEKRREMLQHLFLREITGAADNIKSLAEMLRSASPREGDAGGTMYDLMSRLLDQSERLRELGRKGNGH